MSVGFGLIKAIVEEQVSLSQLAEEGITEEHLQGDEKRAYIFLQRHCQEYSVHPNIITIAVEIEKPTCFQGLPTEPLEFWVQRVQDRVRHNIAHKGLNRISSSLCQTKIDDAVEGFKEIHAELQATYVASESSTSGTDPHPFPDVMTGLGGNFSALYSAHLESPMQFFYMTFLTCLGVILADRITLDTEQLPQSRFYAVLLGESADTRKSTALSKTVDFFEEVFPMDSARERWAGMGFEACHGVGSAEGLQTLFNRNRVPAK